MENRLSVLIGQAQELSKMVHNVEDVIGCIITHQADLVDAAISKFEFELTKDHFQKLKKAIPNYNLKELVRLGFFDCADLETLLDCWLNDKKTQDE